MASERQLQILKRGADEWNAWRKRHPAINIDLRQAKLSRADLRGVDLFEAHLEGADLSEARLDEANLTKAHLEGADLSYARLDGADLIDAHLEGANFSRAQMKEASLVGANLKGAEFCYANLRRVSIPCNDLEEANLRGANLEEADLERSNLKKAKLFEANLEGAILREANLEGANLHEAVLKEANLYGANLQGAFLHKSNLEDAYLFSADLRGANLYEANLGGADLRKAQLEGANFNHARLDRVDLTTSSGLQLDNTSIKNTIFEARAKDKWSVLRRNYTGPRMVFTLFFFLLLLVPYLAKTIGWVTVSQWSVQAETRTMNPGPSIENYKNLYPGHSGLLPLALAKPEAKLEPAGFSKQQMSVNAWRLLMGIDRGWPYWGTALLILSFLALRGFLTYAVVPMRDAEERSGWAPACMVSRPEKGRVFWKEPGRFFECYGWLWWPHRALTWLYYLSLGALGFHFWQWLKLPVWLYR